MQQCAQLRAKVYSLRLCTSDKATMETTKTTLKPRREVEIDWLKCLFIVLMVVFHLAYIGDKYPYAKEIVYTFHMSGFLIITGFLAKTDYGGTVGFLRTLGWLFLPYAVLEALYVGASSVLPVRGGVEELSFGVLADKVLLHPIGPYWYIHTMIVCYAVNYFAAKALPRIGTVAFMAAVGTVLYALDAVAGILSFGNAIYFMVGLLIRRSGLRFADVFRPSIAAAVPLVILCCFEENLDRATLAGVVITYLVSAVALSLMHFSPQPVRRVALNIGANTLPILLFSPLFTMAAKPLIKPLSFDPTGFLFLVVATALAVAGSLAIAYVMDRLRLSPLFCGRNLLRNI